MLKRRVLIGSLVTALAFGAISPTDTVTSIGDDAFSRCTGLKTISIGKGLKTMGKAIR